MNVQVIGGIMALTPLFAVSAYGFYVVAQYDGWAKALKSMFLCFLGVVWFAVSFILLRGC
jgi:hypothetical protein